MSSIISFVLGGVVSVLALMTATAWDGDVRAVALAKLGCQSFADSPSHNALRPPRYNTGNFSDRSEGGVSYGVGNVPGGTGNSRE